MSEFEQTLNDLNGSIATIKAGCTITPDEGLYADSIYYRCKEYIKAYKDAKYLVTTSVTLLSTTF